MPWQRLAAEVGGEYDPDTGIPYYREVVITVPRQSGKTTLYLTWQINRCTSPRWRQPQRSAFTAQSGKDARDKWLDELYPLIRRSRKVMPLVSRMNEGMGNESIRFRNGSLIRLLSTSSSSGHSKTLHQAVLDEIWHDADSRREQGLRPAMITVPDAQLLVCSTAGTEMSFVLNHKVAVGRLAAEADIGHGVAYIEYSAPDDWDPGDEESYYGFMPALCPDPPCHCGGGRWRHTVTLDAVRAERQAMEAPDFARAYGNISHTPRMNQWQVIPEARWLSRRKPGARTGGLVALAADVTPDRTWSAIAAAGVRVDGEGRVVEVTADPGKSHPGDRIDHRPGTSWVIPRLKELQERVAPCVVVTSDRALADAAEESDLKVILANAGNMASSASMLFDGFAGTSPDVWHLDQPELTDAVAGATKRTLGDGWAWDRRSVSVDISPLVACSLALWGLATPRIHTSRLVPFALT